LEIGGCTILLPGGRIDRGKPARICLTSQHKPVSFAAYFGVE